MKFCIYPFLFLLLPAACFAQVTISGRIIGQADTKPVANASVFLNNATIGATTGEDGTFTLKGVKPGKYQLIVSIIGFDSYSQQITVNQDNLDLHDITIFPKTIALNEVKIKPKDESGRDFDLALFKQYFLGTSPLAESCDILNPQILDLDYDDDTKTLTASTTDFLLIKNNGLGYKISYLVKNFTLSRTANEIHYDGSVLFEELKGSASQEKRWKKNREEAYNNSSMHFLRALLANNFAEEGFQVQLVTGTKGSVQKLITAPLVQENIFKQTSQKGIYSFYAAGGFLFVSYSKNHRFYLKTATSRINDPTNRTSTLVAFNSTDALFDSNGILLNPGGVIFSGAWANNRVADLLPSDYEPPASDVLSSDSTSLKAIEGKLENYSADLPVEKVYLHLDKQVYFPGDTVWYKAYTVSAQHRLSAISSVLYAELIDAKDSVIKRETLNLFDGTTAGDFVLPAKPGRGGYRLRAYTNWMRNSSAGDIYDHKLLIAGNAPGVARAQPAPPRPDIQFFPEGGDLVNGLRSKVAVKSINTGGLGEDVSGTIVDNDGHEVAGFKTQHLGMGVFAFTPQSGKSYRAKISAEGKPDVTIDLPKALDAGCTLAINNSEKDSIYIKLAANGELLKAKPNSAFYVVAQSGGKVYYTSTGRLNASVFSFSIEKSRFPSGIVQFTLFSARMEPLNERIAFIQRDDTLKLKLDSTSMSAGPRQRMAPQLVANDNENNPAIGSFSVSVTNESLAQTEETEESTIFNNLLLTSDLKGYIEKPNYYFINPNDQTRADLDVLMLTQGYRRYEWKQILERDRPELTWQPEKTLSLEGIVATSSGKPIANRRILMAVNKLAFFADTVADAKGHFIFTGLDLPDSSKVLFNAGEHAEVKIIKKQFLPAGSNDPARGMALSPEIERLLNQNYDSFLLLQKNDSLKHTHMLKEVTIKDLKIHKQPDLTGSANLNGPGNANQILMADQLDNCISLADCLDGKLHFIYEEGGKFFAQRYQNFINFLPGATVVPAMVIIVDGAIMDSSYLGQVNAKDVESVEVLISGAYTAIYGSNAPFGALVITTKRSSGHPDTSQIVSSLVKYCFNGFYRTRTFYTPAYDHPQTTTVGKDLRSTVYWDPYLITGKDGKASFDYYNADAKGTYRVVIEGIDINGHLGRMVYRYSVQ